MKKKKPKENDKDRKERIRLSKTTSERIVPNKRKHFLDKESKNWIKNSIKLWDKYDE